MTKLEEIINKHRIDANHWADQDFTDETVEIIAKEYAEFCCEQQKKICSNYAEIHYELVTDCAEAPFIDTDSILNAPTYKEEDGK